MHTAGLVTDHEATSIIVQDSRPIQVFLKEKLPLLRMWFPF